MSAHHDRRSVVKGSDDPKVRLEQFVDQVGSGSIRPYLQESDNAECWVSELKGSGEYVAAIKVDGPSPLVMKDCTFIEPASNKAIAVEVHDLPGSESAVFIFHGNRLSVGANRESIA